MSIPSWAVPGAKVVCVKEGEWGLLIGSDPRPPKWQMPVFSMVYTVSWAFMDGDGQWLVLSDMSPEDAWAIRFFRPVVNDTTEATLFRAKHQPVRDREAERA